MIVLKYENLWDIPSTNEEMNSTDNIIDIIRQQGQYLKDSTKGKIFGRFAKIKKVSPLATMGVVLTAFSPREVLQNDDSNELIDANELYSNQKYGFEIYNSTYKFRVFEMVISPVYPVQIIIDEGIANNIEEEIPMYASKGNAANHYAINSDNDLLGCLKLVFSSKKVRYLLFKLQQQVEEKKTD